MKRVICWLIGHRKRWFLVCWLDVNARWKQRCTRCNEVFQDLPFRGTINGREAKDTVCPSCEHRSQYNIEHRIIMATCMVCQNFDQFKQKLN